MSLPFSVLTCPTASSEIRFSCLPLLLTCLSLAFLLVAGVQRTPKCEHFHGSSRANNGLPSCKVMSFVQNAINYRQQLTGEGGGLLMTGLFRLLAEVLKLRTSSAQLLESQRGERKVCPRTSHPVWSPGCPSGDGSCSVSHGGTWVTVTSSHMGGTWAAGLRRWVKSMFQNGHSQPSCEALRSAGHAKFGHCM